MAQRSRGSQRGSVLEETKPENLSRPAPLPRLDYQLFRQTLAGLVDPHQQPGVTEKEAVKQDAIRFCSVLAKLFGDNLDRLTLWSRIGSALETSVAKVSDDDLDRFADLCVEHIQADMGAAAACDALTQMRQAWESRPPEWRHAFLGYIKSHTYAVLAHGRARWEEVKEGKVEL